MLTSAESGRLTVQMLPKSVRIPMAPTSVFVMKGCIGLTTCAKVNFLIFYSEGKQSK